MKLNLKDSKINFPVIEEMKCPSCMYITGHKIEKGYWTCVICRTPLKK